MDETSFAERGLDDPRLAAHATGAAPVWLWSRDGARVLWANLAGCAAFGVTSFGALAARTFAPDAPARVEVARLSKTLPRSGATRFERMRGFPGHGRAPLWRPPVCSCALFRLDHVSGVLVVATEAAGLAIPLAEPVSRLDLDADTAVAAIAPAPARPATDAPVQTKPLAVTAERCPKAPAPSSMPEIAARRHPLRFVWQMDPGGRFTLGSDEFTEIIGTRNAIELGRPWQEISAELGVDPAGRLAAAVETRETWSNITVSWPIDGSDERLDVELAGLPAFDRNRTFLGYRGFGVCRDIDRIERLRSIRRLALFAPAPPRVDALALSEPQSPGTADHHAEEIAALPIAPNVVPFPSPTGFGETKPGAEHKSPALSAGEHVAFRELARQLTARLQDSEAAPAVEPAPDHAEAQTASAVAAGPAVAAAEASGRSAAGTIDDTQNAFDDHTLLSRLPVGILVYRLEELLFANRAFLAMTGYADLSALSGAGGLAALFVEAGIGALADTGEGGRRLAIATRSGNQLPVEGRLFAIRWYREPAFAVVLAKAETDERIRVAETARHQAEAQLRELRKTATLGKSEAMANLCHNARTPLNSILGFCDIMLDERYGPIGNQRYRDYVHDVRQAGAHLMARLVDAVDLANIEAGTFSLTPREISLNDVVADCVARMQPEANEGHVIVRTSLSLSTQKITADAAAVRQMVANLLGCAIKGSRPGGQVIISTGVSPDGCVVLRLRDNGYGLSANAIEAALQPAGPQATTPPFAGRTLALTKALADANHVRFKVTSRPNEGSLFELTFTGKPEVAG